MRHLDALDTVFADYEHLFDPVGRVLSEIYNGQTTAFSYDPTDQLIGADRPGTWFDETFTYDLNGNRLASSLGAASRHYTIGPNNQLLSEDKFRYDYDQQGNLFRQTETATGIVTDFTYDHGNRLVEVVEKSASGIILKLSQYVYDAFGHRITTLIDLDGAGSEPAMVSHTVYDGLHAWADYNAAGVLTARYAYSDHIDELIARWRPAEGDAWYLTDPAGNVRELRTHSGALINRIDYSSFGEVLSQTNPAAGDRFLFNGREFDTQTGLFFYRARFYSPRIGRFQIEDPLGYAGGDTNLYGYVRNRPTDRSDPLGLTETGENAGLNFLKNLKALTQQTIQQRTAEVRHFLRLLRSASGEEKEILDIMIRNRRELLFLERNFLRIINQLISNFPA